MAECIWFFGASGAGKASLITKIAKGQFRVPGIGSPVICHESLEFNRDQRETLLEPTLRILALQADGEVLVKGQSTDLSRFFIPYHLRQKNPEISQKVVFVYTPPDLLRERTAQRRDDYWPNPDHDFQSETEFQIAEVGKLCAYLAIDPTIIDNSADEPRIFAAELDELH